MLQEPVQQGKTVTAHDAVTTPKTASMLDDLLNNESRDNILHNSSIGDILNDTNIDFLNEDSIDDNLNDDTEPLTVCLGLCCH